jgi:putative transposase
LALPYVAGYGIGIVAEVMGLSLATLRRHHTPAKKRTRPSPERKLTASEEAFVLRILHSDRFIDRSPLETYYTLLDEGVYYGSPRTFYRVLAKHKEVGERRNQRSHPPYAIPRLVASGPNQVWTWDITKLKGPSKGKFYYLYVIIDLFSRFVVGWMLATSESAELAKMLVKQAVLDQGISEDQIALHSDRGAPMTAKKFVDLVQALGIFGSFSRPRVSNDNPYIESHFKTLKYCPEYPGQFGSYEDAEAFCRRFFSWYNDQHQHSGIVFLTPRTVHERKAGEVLMRRQVTLNQAYLAHPERFGRRPRVHGLPEKVWINNPLKAVSVRPNAGSQAA